MSPPLIFILSMGGYLVISAIIVLLRVEARSGRHVKDDDLWMFLWPAFVIFAIGWVLMWGIRGPIRFGFWAARRLRRSSLPKARIVKENK